MPPRQKFTKGEIIKASLEIVRQEGIQAVTARGLGSKLGSSSRPVFTVFKNMDELLQETMKAARDIYNSYIEEALKSENAFFETGKKYIEFAVREPKLFCLLFMQKSEVSLNLENVLENIDGNSGCILEAVKKRYNLDEAAATAFYKEMWIFTHGIASLIATGVCTFREDEIMSMMSQVCRGLVKR